MRHLLSSTASLFSLFFCVQCPGQSTAEPSQRAAGHAQLESFFASHCLECHHRDDATAGLAIDDLDLRDLSRHAEEWEKVVRRMAARQMPPRDAARPEESDYQRVIETLGNRLDEIDRDAPKPGRTETFRRLNRTEYRNAIRDLLGLDIDVSTLLPADEASHGFDNVTVADLSPMLLNRFVSAAEKISQLAVGTRLSSPGGETIRLPPDLTQEDHIDGLPLGTRGGGVFTYHFPRNGEYEIDMRLTRDRNENVEGLTEPHVLDLLLDRQWVKSFTVKPLPRGKDVPSVDAHLRTTLAVEAGSHELVVTFRKQSSALLETKRQPLNARFNFHRHPRATPAIYQVSITGPHVDRGPGETLSRQRIFTRESSRIEDEQERAIAILSPLIRRAYRRPIEAEDLARPMQQFRETRASGDFEASIESALAAILVSPHFLFRIEMDPHGLPPATAYRLSDLELASRLAFFLWSSLPDDELLDRAERGELTAPGGLREQVMRMLRDDRALSLVDNFASQWLYLRNLDSTTPDARLYPDFDDNLRQAFRRETELLLESVLREDRSVLDLIRSDATYLNERLAKHYEIPHIYGSRMRRVPVDGQATRGGILRHGSILTVTSYATRTSPVIRGHWILKNLLGTAPPPPPPDVPDLDDNAVATALSVRERLEIHRAAAACASCHDLMDPIGFALENFDAVGRFREFELGQPIDASGGLPDGSQFDGVSGLEDGLLRRPDEFVGAMAEKLLTFAVGRGVEIADAPAVRQIVRQSKADHFRFSSLILALVESVPFQMRSTR